MVLSATMPPLSPTRSPAADVDTDTTTDTGADAVVAAGSAGSANASVATRHRRRGRLAAIAILVALIAVGAPLSLALGSRSVPLDVVWDSMRHLRELLQLFHAAELRVHSRRIDDIVAMVRLRHGSEDRRQIQV